MVLPLCIEVCHDQPFRLKRGECVELANLSSFSFWIFICSFSKFLLIECGKNSVATVLCAVDKLKMLKMRYLLNVWIKFTLLLCNEGLIEQTASLKLLPESLQRLGLKMKLQKKLCKADTLFATPLFHLIISIRQLTPI